MSITLILLLAGFALGTRFTVFILVPVGVLVTIGCLVWNMSFGGSATLLTWIVYLTALNVGFLAGSIWRTCSCRRLSNDRYV